MLYVKNIVGSDIYIQNTLNNTLLKMSRRSLITALSKTPMRIFGAERVDFSHDILIDKGDWVLEKSLGNDGIPVIKGHSYVFSVYLESDLPFDLEKRLSKTLGYMAKAKVLGVDSIEYLLIGYDAYSRTCLDISCKVKVKDRGKLDQYNVLRIIDGNVIAENELISSDKISLPISSLFTVKLPDTIEILNCKNLVSGYKLDRLFIPKSVKGIIYLENLYNVHIIEAPKELMSRLNCYNNYKVIYY